MLQTLLNVNQNANSIAAVSVEISFPVVVGSLGYAHLHKAAHKHRQETEPGS